MKITFMGAGSTIFARNVIGDCMCTPALCESEFALYDIDESLPLRKSHENPQVKEVYDNFLGKPCGHLSHDLLHTTYQKADKKYTF